MNDGLSLLNGGPIPRITPGAVADLIVDAFALTNEKQRRVYTSFVAEQILPAGTMLLAGLNPEATQDELISSREADILPFGWTQFAKIKLLEPLELALRATKRASLKACRCGVPALGKEARSLNHAYTKLSEQFEPHRISHTGNVFQGVFYWERVKGGHRWEPLGTLRQGLEARIEQERAAEVQAARPDGA